ncbi:precorrin-2 dehydrogenase/sirohydrochlorin ferrochelatase family protein [Salibacterium halotolerans]|uniref:precorrin-2 dehydrogenase n=1 Tax=Salibacterium halotolerans TaxID=1884432 RepID=A0A1I5RHX4_9BACI|nr:bifunctional precorrin-2 dehydrogenase/sirohydrochlorin ferrochelatase [Salibacterium halotolerans]SFP58138.1 precorrin-2 dehydrogenase / sirohydrochlorin ferrochelatase [Salibacterium halotolerans]
MFNFPLFLDLTGKPVVVIGGGTIASRKINKLLEAGANIVVVAPWISDSVRLLYEKGEVHWVKDECRADYLASAFLIVSASGNPEARRIIKESVHPHQLLNAADDPETGNAAFPATLEESGYHIAVSTEGQSPAAAKNLKQKLRDRLREMIEKK